MNVKFISRYDPNSLINQIRPQFALEVVLAAGDVRITHTDPADRLLAATARYYELRLVNRR